MLLSYISLDFLGIVGPKKIKNLSEVPGLPIIGNIHQTLSNASLVYSKWAKQYGDVYQVRMGDRRVVVVNSYDAIKELWLQNRNKTNSRPSLYTFHSVVSSTQGFTIGTTPFGESYQRKKKFAATNLNKMKIQNYTSLIDESSESIIDKIISDISTNKGIDEVNLTLYIQAYTLKIALFITFNYELNFDTKFHQDLLKEICYVENQITRLRSHTSNFQDYIPMLNLFSNQLNARATQLRKRRDVYMNFFTDELQRKVANCDDYEEINCLVYNAWKQMENEETKLTTAELKSVCLTMVSAGLDNSALNLFYCLGHLSQSEYGYKIQEIAREQLLKYYDSLEEAYKKAPFDKLKVPYIVAILKETLRHLTVLPVCLPRETTDDIMFKNCIIPKKTLLFMNAYAGNHDESYFPNPNLFVPERWLKQENEEEFTLKVNLTHFSFGLGSRMCIGNHLSFQEMYTLLVRLLVKFEIREPEKYPKMINNNPFELNEVPNSVAIEPVDYRIKLVNRM